MQSLREAASSRGDCIFDSITPQLPSWPGGGLQKSGAREVDIGGLNVLPGMISVDNIAYNRLADSTYTEALVRVNAVDVISNSWKRAFLFFPFSLFPEFICSPIYLATLYPIAAYVSEIALRI